MTSTGTSPVKKARKTRLAERVLHLEVHKAENLPNMSLLGISTGQDGISVEAYLVPAPSEANPETTQGAERGAALKKLLPTQSTAVVFGGGQVQFFVTTQQFPFIHILTMDAILPATFSQNPQWIIEGEHPLHHHLLFPCSMWEDAQAQHGVQCCQLRIDVMLHNELGYKSTVGSIELQLDDPTIAASAATKQSHVYGMDSSDNSASVDLSEPAVHCSLYYSNNYVYTVQDLPPDESTDGFSSMFGSWGGSAGDGAEENVSNDSNQSIGEADGKEEAAEQTSLSSMGRKLSTALGLDSLARLDLGGSTSASEEGDAPAGSSGNAADSAATGDADGESVMASVSLMGRKLSTALGLDSLAVDLDAVLASPTGAASGKVGADAAADAHIDVASSTESARLAEEAHISDAPPGDGSTAT